MIRRSLSGLPLIAFAALLSGTSLEQAAAAEEAAKDMVECSLSQVEINPGSVIVPCSRVIADQTKPPPDRGFALFIRGMGYHNTKRFALAGQDYDAAIELTPTNEELLVSRANIAFRGDRLEEGVSFLQRVLALNSSNGHALRTLGALNDGMGALEEASHQYSMALAANPNDAYALLFRSKNGLQRRQFDAALRDADALVAIAPDDINRQGYLDENGDRLDFHIIALKNRAHIHDVLGHFDQAEQDLNSAVTYCRSSASLAARGQFLAYRPGREKDAFGNLNEAISLGDTDFYTFYALGMTHTKLRQFRDALAAFDQAAAIAPLSGDALRMRARMHRELDQTDLAFDDMMQAITISDFVLRETMPALRAAGYWRSSEVPTELTPDFEDAIRACMLDKRCN